MKALTGFISTVWFGTRNPMLHMTPMRDATVWFGTQNPMFHMTPMRDAGWATSIHDGMRTAMCDRAWNPCAPMST
ncbi:putative transcription elongation factor SPT5 homolog 1 [Amborella trichopoda]|uniref:putative transcription elongation factor SPT5 homolog 1 n=1 Tax=Amborella trichopoda TaxID=13333 RepID=UPI0009BE87BC|nr:putative transcription elongation factor SPT5 homolog 1 [Amborella trichopoda]|eukprot:XP_020521900.1 putative transcription elongation factor SPT5 homolog 1 [Amborella trichopoda]